MVHPEPRETMCIAMFVARVEAVAVGRSKPASGDDVLHNG